MLVLFVCVCVCFVCFRVRSTFIQHTSVQHLLHLQYRHTSTTQCNPTHSPGPAVSSPDRLGLSAGIAKKPGGKFKGGNRATMPIIGADAPPIWSAPNTLDDVPLENITKSMKAIKPIPAIDEKSVRSFVRSLVRVSVCVCVCVYLSCCLASVSCCLASMSCCRVVACRGVLSVFCLSIVWFRAAAADTCHELACYLALHSRVHRKRI